MVASGHVGRSDVAESIEICVFDAVAIEPTDVSFDEAIRFARDARVDGYISIGGGSVIDTTKAANLYVTHPAELRRYVNAPLGDGVAVPGALVTWTLVSCWAHAAGATATRAAMSRNFPFVMDFSFETLKRDRR